MSILLDLLVSVPDISTHASRSERLIRFVLHNVSLAAEYSFSENKIIMCYLNNIFTSFEKIIRFRNYLHHLHSL